MFFFISVIFFIFSKFSFIGVNVRFESILIDGVDVINWNIVIVFVDV